MGTKPNLRRGAGRSASLPGQPFLTETGYRLVVFPQEYAL